MHMNSCKLIHIKVNRDRILQYTLNTYYTWKGRVCITNLFRKYSCYSFQKNKALVPNSFTSLFMILFKRKSRWNKVTNMDQSSMTVEFSHINLRNPSCYKMVNAHQSYSSEKTPWPGHLMEEWIYWGLQFQRLSPWQSCWSTWWWQAWHWSSKYLKAYVWSASRR